MVAIASPPASPSTPDLAQLYAQHARQLERRVRRGIRVPQPVVEDACQLAWSRLLRHRERVQRETVLAWLAATARHEALRMWSREQREESLEKQLEAGDAGRLPQVSLGPDEMLELRQRLMELGGVSSRQKRLLWLQALGLDYAEMADHEGCTRRTVERQLMRARRVLKPLAG